MPIEANVPMRYLPDGPALDGLPHLRLGPTPPGRPTPALTLCAGPGAAVPPALRADTVTGMALRLLRTTDTRAALDGIETVTTGVFDGDHLLALFALTQPDAALARVGQLESAARAVAFGVCRSEEERQIACFVRSYPDEAGIHDPAALYATLVPEAVRLLDSPRDFDLYWIGEYSDVLRADYLLNSGAVQVDEAPDLDLTTIQTPLDLHDLVRLTAARGHRVLTVRSENTYILEYRRESWVRFPLVRPLPRIDLRPLAQRLGLFERAPGVWRTDPVTDPTPRLFLDDGRGRPSPSTLDAQTVIAEVMDYLRAAGRRPELQWTPDQNA